MRNAATQLCLVAGVPGVGLFCVDLRDRGHDTIEVQHECVVKSLQVEVGLESWASGLGLGFMGQLNDLDDYATIGSMPIGHLKYMQHPDLLLVRRKSKNHIFAVVPCRMELIDTPSPG